MIAKLKAFLTDLYNRVKTNVLNAVALLGTMMGSVLSHIDAIAATLGDPNLTQQISSVIADAKWIGRWVLMVGIVATIAKFKALVQSPPRD